MELKMGAASLSVPNVIFGMIVLAAKIAAADLDEERGRVK
jgi:hypothetical protein